MSGLGAPKPKLKLKFGASFSGSPSTPSAPSLPSASEDAQKKSPASAKKAAKKRPRDADGDANGSANKQQKISLNLSTKGLSGSGAPPKLITKGLITPKLKLKTATQKLSLVSKSAGGFVIERKKGTGYDSEAEDIEREPLIEHQFVVRMPPGDDCDYLRKAIAEREIGTNAADVKFRFFDKDGRRAMVTIRGKHYAASIVDLPTIVENHKSWDRKNFYKVADIHQMLLIANPVKGPDEARKAPIPEFVDEQTWQYPHGLTPPMHWVRKRRFRKRVSKRTIEAVEEEVERLLALDNDIEKSGGASKYELFDPNAREDEDQSMDVDGEGEVEDSIEVDEVEDDDDEFARMIEAGLAGDDDDQPIVPGMEVVASPDTVQQVTETPDVAMTPSSPADSADDEFGDSEDDLDDDERAAQQEIAQMREEADAIKKEIDNLDKQIATQGNRILKQKLQDKKAKLVRDWEIKKANLGESIDDDEE
jgi:transcription initiation factor TFIID subunit 7